MLAVKNLNRSELYLWNASELQMWFRHGLPMRIQSGDALGQDFEEYSDSMFDLVRYHEIRNDS
eukprot:5364563-Amphidinium_carterae.1